jgi:hypothetical protein
MAVGKLAITLTFRFTRRRYLSLSIDNLDTVGCNRVVRLRLNEEQGIALGLAEF